LSLTLLRCLSALAAAHVVLTNGDTITGAIIKKDGDKFTIKSEFRGRRDDSVVGGPEHQQR
jgi:hypothetical protein